ncbi:DUF4226 domain-containing protein [Mycolicibacterium canariasense]|nr:DUF4226 domain-containing protein [Mycolicibacterium canariasense]ORV04487.1 hypothetical protein AWB94_22590 [Mycolicibacterium canariasense]
MSVLTAFLATWDNARATLGAGTPVDGSQFDMGGRLERFRETVLGTAPGEQWTGSAAEAYTDRNHRLAGTIGRIAELDRRLGAEVDRSADVVASGRRDLDAVKQWVLSAAATVPPNAAGERTMMTVVSKGVADIAEIVHRSNSDMTGIANRIRDTGTGYQALADGAPR